MFIFVESHCNKSVRPPSSSLCPQNVRYDVPIYFILFYFRSNCDWLYQKACSQCVHPGMWFTHTLHKNKQSVHKHTHHQTVFDSVQYILAENIVIARESCAYFHIQDLSFITHGAGQIRRVQSPLSRDIP